MLKSSYWELARERSPVRSVASEARLLLAVIGHWSLVSSWELARDDRPLGLEAIVLKGD
jgi:hypothetical protein